MPWIHPMAAFWLWFSITSVQTVYPVPVQVSGVVVHGPSQTPVENAEIDLVWTAGPFFVDRMRRLGQTESGVDGRFAVQVAEGPVTSLRVRSPDGAYWGTLDLGPNSSPDDLVIEVEPGLSVATGRAWEGGPPRLGAIVRRLLADHIPGTPPPTVTLRQHFEAGRLSAEDLEYLVENRHRFSGVSLEGLGPPPTQARVYWGEREMDYGTADDALRFLTPIEQSHRNLLAAAATGDQGVYLKALSAAFVAEESVTAETIRRWRQAGLIHADWQEEMARSLLDYQVPQHPD